MAHPATPNPNPISITSHPTRASRAIHSSHTNLLTNNLLYLVRLNPRNQARLPPARPSSRQQEPPRGLLESWSLCLLSSMAEDTRMCYESLAPPQSLKYFPQIGGARSTSFRALMTICLLTD